MFVSQHAGAGSQTYIFWKSSQFSSSEQLSNYQGSSVHLKTPVEGCCTAIPSKIKHSGSLGVPLGSLAEEIVQQSFCSCCEHYKLEPSTQAGHHVTLQYGGESKGYVGNLGTGVGKGELERAFSYYGPLRTVWIARNPPGFAFVEFEDPRDAEDAVRGLDGKVICGSRVRVELSTGMPRRSRFDRPPACHPFDPNDRCYECGEQGHYAYDYHRCSRRRSRSRSRSHSGSKGRRYSYSRSRSCGRRSRSTSPL